jgi:hypothetical protein
MTAPAVEKDADAEALFWEVYVDDSHPEELSLKNYVRIKVFNERGRFKLPAGFDVDELPDAVKLDSEFGTYTASYEVKDGQLVFTRSLVQRAATVPVEKYTDVRNFFGRVRASEEAPVVLARK